MASPVASQTDEEVRKHQNKITGKRAITLSIVRMASWLQY